MRLNPAATKASSNLKDVRASAVHPKTFPPKASGATANLELPKPRFFIRYRDPESCECSDQNGGELRFGCILVRPARESKNSSSFKKRCRTISSLAAQTPVSTHCCDRMMCYL